MNDTTIAGRASLRKKLPGIDDQIGRAVSEMVDYFDTKYEGKPKPFQVWFDIRPNIAEGLRVATSWSAFVIAQGPRIGKIRMPVIPDEFNPRPDKLVKEDDEPHKFHNMGSAERAADDAVTVMRAELNKLFRSQQRPR